MPLIHNHYKGYAEVQWTRSKSVYRAKNCINPKEHFEMESKLFTQA